MNSNQPFRKSGAGAKNVLSLQVAFHMWSVLARRPGTRLLIKPDSDEQNKPDRLVKQQVRIPIIQHLISLGVNI